MENKYRTVKSFIKLSKKLISRARCGCFDETLFAQIKGNLKLLDEGDYQKFSSFLNADGSTQLKNIVLFLEEKIVSYKNYDFWPENQRIKEREYKIERNLFFIKLLNSIIDFLVWIRNKIGGT